MRRFAALSSLVLLLASGCAGGEDITGERRNVGGVTVTFTVDPSAVEVGQTVQFRIRLVNNSGTAAELVFPTGQRYDFWVTSSGSAEQAAHPSGSEVWRWSDGMVFTQAITELTIEAQTGQTFTGSFAPEEAGSFVAHGVILADGYEGEMSGELEAGRT